MYPITDKLPFEVWLCDFYPNEAYNPGDYLLIYVVTGHLDVKVNDTVWHFSQEDVFLIQPEESYHILPGTDFLLCAVRMDLHFILRCCDYQRPVFIVDERDRRLNTGAPAGCLPQLLEKIDFLADCYYQEPRANTARLTYHFYEFAWFFIENFRKEPQGRGENQKNQRIWAITDYIETNYNLPITLGQLADELGLTPQYLSGFIRKHMDTTFNTILYDIRFKHALLDLAQSSTDITRIILNNGFPNASGFNRMFRNRSFDAIVDQLHRLGIIPMIALQQAPGNAFFNIRPFCDCLKRTLMHALDRYGQSYVSQWKIEIVRGSEQLLAQYIPDSEKIIMAARSVCTDIGFGGPLLELEHEAPELTALLEGWAQRRIVPDFLTVSAYPYADGSTVSIHPDIIYRRLAALHGRLRNHCRENRWYAGRDIVLYVVDFGFTHAPKSYMNDSIFMADFMLNNFIAMKDCAEIVGCPAMSDLSGRLAGGSSTDVHGRPAGSLNTGVSSADSPLAGANGLLTAQGLRKPVFFALRYLCVLGDRLLDAGQGWIITMDADGRISMILYNYKHPDAYYCQENNHRIGLDDINRFYGDKEPLKFHICLRHLPAATYEAACYRLNQDNGSLLDLWARSGGIQGIKNETLDYLRHTLAPRVSFYGVENTDGVLIQETLAAQEILALVITPRF